MDRLLKLSCRSVCAATDALLGQGCKPTLDLIEPGRGGFDSAHSWPGCLHRCTSLQVVSALIAKRVCRTCVASALTAPCALQAKPAEAPLTECTGRQRTSSAPGCANRRHPDARTTRPAGTYTHPALRRSTPQWTDTGLAASTRQFGPGGAPSP